MVMPGAGYLEMGRTACCAAAASAAVGATLREVFFLQPLVLEEQEGDGGAVECTLGADGRFEVRQLAVDAADSRSVHCTASNLALSSASPPRGQRSAARAQTASAAVLASLFSMCFKLRLICLGAFRVRAKQK